MKTIALPIIIMMMFMKISGQDQDALNRIKHSNKVVWYGLDFSKAKLRQGFYHPKNVQEAYINGWNDILLSQDYDLRKVLKKDSVIIDLSVVSARNRNRTNYYYVLNVDTIQSMITEFHYPEKDGIGLVLIVDQFEKTHDKATIWITFFNISTRKLILIKQYSASGSGAGMVNHWGNAIERILEKADDLY